MNDPTVTLHRELKQITSGISSLQNRLRGELSDLSKDVSLTKTHASRADQGIQALEKSFDTLYHQLHDQLKIVVERLEPLRQMPNLFASLEAVIQKQFELSFIRQFEAQVVSIQSRVLGHRSRIRAFQRLLAIRREQTLAQLEKVQSRYRELLSHVAANNAERRRAMDGHAYALIEEIYPQEVQNRFSFISLPTFGYLAAHASEAALARNAASEDAFQKLEAAIDGFLEESREAFEQVAAWTDEGRQPGTYLLTVYAVEIEDRETGRRRFELRTREGGELPAEVVGGVETFLRGLLRGEAEEQTLADEDRQRLAGALEARGIPRAERDRFRNEEIRQISAA